ncbi:MAG: TIGR04282 family arsenosugar biosynthesis glycosyltransferase [Gammaproteobacteria bacterium]|nr:TIGR04282 family arsenosugar biosynthesis glycosyltransferase [Gammaproteobacteria bacterium]
MRGNSTLILFAKKAQICRVKTRMWPNLSYRESLYLHKALTADAIKKFSANSKFKLILYTTDTKTIHYCKSRGLIIKRQYGLDLGSRMIHAISQELKYSQKVVLIGSDCPTLNVDYIKNAFMHLSKNNDVVLGPTTDGGYVLIGMKKKNDYLFKNITWGSSNVFNQTLKVAANYRCNIKSLEKVSDIDTAEDLHEFNIKRIYLHGQTTQLLKNRLAN